nr:hypothetical protein [Lachnospiraceae bacterium]
IPKELNITPAPAANAIRPLVERGVLDKVRGQAMTVKKGAVDMIKERKVEETLNEMLNMLVSEACKLGIGKDELVERLKRSFEER